MNIINQIVDRCHVSRSNRDVINYVVSRLRDKRKTFFNMSRVQRRQLMAGAIKRHAENRKLYKSVMG